MINQKAILMVVKLKECSYMHEFNNNVMICKYFFEACYNYNTFDVMEIRVIVTANDYRACHLPSKEYVMGFESRLFIFYGKRDVQVSCIYCLALIYVGLTVSK